jgi:putative membrane protein
MVFSMDAYFWYKALHIISFVAWMAGLFYLPRLYVYHCKVLAGSEADGLFKIMELKLLRFIMNPAMIATFIFGFAMIAELGFSSFGGWLHFKLLLLIFLAGFHGMLARYRRSFAEGRNQKSEGFFRVINEVPTVLLIGIVLLAVFKPF